MGGGCECMQKCGPWIAPPLLPPPLRPRTSSLPSTLSPAAPPDTPRPFCPFLPLKQASPTPNARVRTAGVWRAHTAARASHAASLAGVPRPRLHTAGGHASQRPAQCKQGVGGVAARFGARSQPD
eukprot:362242-Chlamydomonas_euryale.AAC.3